MTIEDNSLKINKSPSSPSGQDGGANLLNFSPPTLSPHSPPSTGATPSSPNSSNNNSQSDQSSSSSPSKPVTPHCSESESNSSAMMTEPPLPEDEPQVTLIGSHLKSVTFNLPTQQNKLEEREKQLAELEARLKDKEQKLDAREQELVARLKDEEQKLEMRVKEFELKADEWTKLYEGKKRELMALESRENNAQPSFTGRDVRMSLENENGAPEAASNQPESIRRKSYARPRTINEEEMENSNADQPDGFDDDAFEIKTPPRSFSRPSIGQWSVERRKNNMSVKSMISNFENCMKKGRS